MAAVVPLPSLGAGASPQQETNKLINVVGVTDAGASWRSRA
jgi:hypothetical protein